MSYSYASKQRNEISATFQIEHQISNLTSLVLNLATSMSNAQQGVQGHNYDPFSNTYNDGWWNNSNYNYLGHYQEPYPPNYQEPYPPQSQEPYPPYYQEPYPLQFQEPYQALEQPYPYQSQTMPQSQEPSLEDLVNSLVTLSQPQPKPQSQEPTLEELVKSLAISQKNLELQMSQLASDLGEIRAQEYEELPYQTEINLWSNVSEVTLESEEQFEECPQRAPEKEDELEEKNSTLEKAESAKEKLAPKVTFKVSTTSNTPFPFPYRFIKKDEHEKEMLDTFREVEINKPIFDAIKLVPKYEFFKELCINKREQGDAFVSIGESCWARPQRKFPQNLKNPKSLTITCTFEAKRYHSNFNYYFSIDTSNSLWQPLFELKNKDEWEESFNMSQKEEQFGDKVVKTMAPLVFFLAKIVHYVHPSIFKPPWENEEQSQAKGL